jgi:aerobic-type carbon monoxide dehydrogenase small subunit (CoxS/CutS family)
VGSNVAASPPHRTITVTVNGVEYTRTVEHRLTLADFLRHHIDLTGTHLGCEHGVCGACTVLIDGLSMRSCLMLASQAMNRQVTTVEGLAAEGDLTALQEAFWEHHGLQCGFCTPGILMSLSECLRDNPQPTEDQIRDVLSGHLCRCTGYQNIVDAALDAAESLRKKNS